MLVYIKSIILYLSKIFVVIESVRIFALSNVRLKKHPAFYKYSLQAFLSFFAVFLSSLHPQ